MEYGPSERWHHRTHLFYTWSILTTIQQYISTTALFVCGDLTNLCYHPKVKEHSHKDSCWYYKHHTCIHSHMGKNTCTGLDMFKPVLINTCITKPMTFHISTITSSVTKHEGHKSVKLTLINLILPRCGSIFALIDHLPRVKESADAVNIYRSNCLKQD